MPRYHVLTIGGERYFPMRYDELPVGESRTPVTALVPYHDSLEDALVAVQRFSDDRLAPLRARMRGTSADAGASYEDRLANPTIFYRGQSDLAFSIVPTRFRLAGVADAAAEVARRIEGEARHAAAVRQHFAQSTHADLTELQSRAVARHFGAPSTLVDFTFDPEVAAAFSHPAFSARESREGAPFGMLYAIDMGQLQEMFGMMAWALGADGGREIHLVNLKEEWGLPFRAYDAERGEVVQRWLSVPVPQLLREQHARLRTCIVPGVSRIRSQRGLFLELALDDPTNAAMPLFFWTLLDFVAHKWCFRRRDRAFVVHEADGTARDLFHEADPALAELPAPNQARGHA